jgi:hypothetical protein
MSAEFDRHIWLPQHLSLTAIAVLKLATAAVGRWFPVQKGSSISGDDQSSSVVLCCA